MQLAKERHEDHLIHLKAGISLYVCQDGAEVDRRPRHCVGYLVLSVLHNVRFDL